jgi:hypothetical protein
MLRGSSTFVYSLAGLLLAGCGGNNQQTQEQRSAIRQPLFATEHTIIDRPSDGVPTIDEQPANNPRFFF